MFIKKILKRNSELLVATRQLFKKGLIDPNTYVIDLDSVIANAKLLFNYAKKHNLVLYQMTKQFGRNPLIANAIKKVGIKKAVCVDPWEAIKLKKAGIEIGNVGHLVQIPKQLIDKIIKLKPEVITIFSIAKAKQISESCVKLQHKQAIILKVVGQNDMLLPGQEGGIKLEKLEQAIKAIKKLPNLQIIGFTAYPTFYFDLNIMETKPTKNLFSVLKAVKIAKKNKLKIKHINLPGANSMVTLKYFPKLGGTHAEPGHAFTGTNPSHAFFDQYEKPALVYVSEVSHIFENKAFIYAGGYYRRGNLSNFIVAKNKKFTLFKANQLNPEAIDYYLNFDIGKHKISSGDLVIASFRTQIFVTRAKVAVVAGISKNNPQLLGQFTSLGEIITNE